MNQINRRRRIKLLVAKYIASFPIGLHRSFMKGWGGDFDTVREWQPGDRRFSMVDTLKTGKIHSKVFQEPKQLTVWILVDVSQSMFFGEKNNYYEAALVILQVLANSIFLSGDRLGLIVFDDEVRLLIQPTQERISYSSVLADLLERRPKKTATNLEPALSRLTNHSLTSTLVLIISDFNFSLSEREKDLLGQISFQPRCTLLPITFCRSLRLVNENLMVEISDSESGQFIDWNFGSDKLFKKLEDEFNLWQADLMAFFQRINTDLFWLDIDGNFIKQLARYFIKNKIYET